MEKVNKFLKNIKPREYQKNIYKTCKDKNCLVVLPTGTGKSLIGTMLTIDRMHKFPDKKILILSPTRPLVAQWLSYFQKHLPELFATMELFTGKIPAKKRKDLWQNADIIFSTPQSISNDLKNNLYNLKDVSLLLEDECLTKDSKIKISYKGGSSIKELYQSFDKDNKIYVDSLGKTGNIEPRRILKIHKILNKKQILEIKTKSNKIKTTEHHLLIIKRDNEIKWIKAKNLKYGDKIATDLKEINEEYKNKTLANEKDITKKYGKSIYQISASIRCIKRLKEKNLLPLDYQNPKLKIIARLIGYILGDGWFTKVNGIAKIAGFSGNIEDLETIQRDLDILDIKYTKISSRETSSLINTSKGNKIIIKGNSNSFTVTDSCLIKLMDALDVPKGDKTIQEFSIPDWIMKAPKFIKKEFLSSLMGCEGDIPKIRKGIRSPYAIRFGFNKLEKLKENGLKYAYQLKKLFEDLAIPCTIQTRKGNIRKNNEKTIMILLTLSNSNKNFLEFLENIGYSYNYKKSREANKIMGYLKYKNTKMKEREFLYKKIIELKGKGNKIHKAIQILAKQYKIKPTRIWSLGYQSKPSHASWKIKSYEGWKEEKKQSLRIKWEQITNIKKARNEKYVYDLTVEENHNYIANNFIVHNCHRCLKNYAYTYVVEKYKQQAKQQRILGLTASPGADKKTIKQIANNLGIEAIEIRTRESDDVKPYLQKLKFQIVKLDFPEELKEIQSLLKELHDKKIEELKNRKLLFAPATKKNVLELQKKIMIMISTGNRNFNILAGASACAQAIKLQYCLELLETQTLSSLQRYFQDLFQQAKQNKSRAVKQLIKQPAFNKAYIQTTELLAKGIENPKLSKLKELINQEFKTSKIKRIIVFSQYRETIVKICKILNEIKGVNARVFVGQLKKGETGLSQKEQQEILRDFSLGKINVMVSSSVGEEGIDIMEVSAVIFYDYVPSVIRKTQRAGRTARLKPGKLIIIMMKGTRDEAYYWAVFHKEKKMHNILKNLKEEFENENKNKKKQLDLREFS